MARAQLIITAVDVEGQSKSEVARDYGVSRYWVQQLVQTLSNARARPRFSRGPGGRIPARTRSLPTPRTGSFGCVRSCPSRDLTRARKPSPPTWRAKHQAMVAGLRCRPSRRSGGSVPPRFRQPATAETAADRRGARFCADQPNERWQADITHWQLADGTECGDLQHRRRPLPAHIAGDRTPGSPPPAWMWSPASGKPSAVGHPGRGAHRQRGGLHRQTTRRAAGSP